MRGRWQTDPATFAALSLVLGLFVIGGIHAFQITGHPWPNDTILFSLGRGDLAIAALLWVGNLVLGRRVLLDDEPDAASRGERGFAVTAVVAAVLVLFFTLF